MEPYTMPTGKKTYTHTYEGYGRLELEIDYDNRTQKATFYPVQPMERVSITIDLKEDA